MLKVHASFKNMKHSFSARHSHKCTYREPSSTYTFPPVKSFFLVTPIRFLRAIPKGTCCGIYFRIYYTALLHRTAYFFLRLAFMGIKIAPPSFFFQCFFQHGLRGKEKNHKPPVGDFLLYARILYFWINDHLHQWKTGTSSLHFFLRILLGSFSTILSSTNFVLLCVLQQYFK